MAGLKSSVTLENSFHVETLLSLYKNNTKYFLEVCHFFPLKLQMKCGFFPLKKVCNLAIVFFQTEDLHFIPNNM